MPRTQDEIVIPIRLDDSEAEAALADVRAKARATANDVVNSTGRAQKGFGGMEDAIRRVAVAEARENRTVRILASELTQLGLVGGRTAAAMSTIAVSLVGGFGLGAAINLVQLAVSSFADQQKKTTAETDRLRQAGERLRNEWEATHKPLQGVTERLERLGKTEAEILRMEVLAPLFKRRLEIQGELVAATDKFALAEAKIAERTDKAAGSMKQFTATIAEPGLVKAIRDGQAALAIIEADIARAEEQLKSLRTGEAAIKAAAERTKKAAADAAQAAQAMAQQTTSSLKQFYEEQARITDEGLAKRAEITTRRNAELARMDREQAVALEVGNDDQRAREVLELEDHYAHLEFLFRDNEARLSEIRAEGAERRRRIVSGEVAFERRAREMVSGFYRQFASSVGNSIGSSLRTSAAYTRAMKAQGAAVEEASLISGAALAAFAQDALASLASEAATEALMNLGRGFAALAAAALGHPGAGAAAALYFKSAAMFGLIGLAAGIGARAIGNARGMTAQERAAVDAARRENEGAPPGGAGGGGGPSAGGPQSIQESGRISEAFGPGTGRFPFVVVNGQLGYYNEFGVFVGIGPATAGAPSVLEPGIGARTVVRETVVVIGDPFETPAEAARRAARRLQLARDLDMAREG